GRRAYRERRARVSGQCTDRSAAVVDQAIGVADGRRGEEVHGERTAGEVQVADGEQIVRSAPDDRVRAVQIEVERPAADVDGVVEGQGACGERAAIGGAGIDRAGVVGDIAIDIAA